MKMEIDFLLSGCVKEKEEVIVFGAGHFGIMTIYLCQHLGLSVITCMDNDINKQGKKLLDGIMCRKPCFIKDIPVIITLADDILAETVAQQCREFGYSEILYVNHEKLNEKFYALPQKEFVELDYAMRCEGKLIDWDNLISYNEKIQWLKLYDRNPEYTKLVDKYEVKKYIAEKVGEEYLVPTLGIWSKFDEIDFEKLPEQFVLKCTHDSGSAMIVKDKSTFDIESAKKRFEWFLNRNYYYESGEWAYKNIQPRIIAEAYLTDESGVELKDYKVFTFQGKAKLIQVDFGRYSQHKRNIYTTDWEYLDLMIKYPTDADRKIERPSQLKKMLEIAEKLSAGIPHVRVDFYLVGDRIYFGEMTFYHGGGTEVFKPEEWNKIMGGWITLPNKKN